MPSVREMLTFVRSNRPAYDAWRAALEYLAHGVDNKTKAIRPDVIDEAIKAEVEGTPTLLFSSRNATLAALYAMGYGKHRGRVAVKVVEIRLSP